MNTNQISRIASLLGEPARTGMLLALMDGRSLTANELARSGHVSAQTGSCHLAQLVDAGLLLVEQRGRHRYHRLASPAVAKVLEGIMQLAVQPSPLQQAQSLRPAVQPGPKDAAMRMARSCYDHIAGRLGVAVSDHLLAEGAVVFDGESGQLTAHAAAVLQPLDLDLTQEPETRRVLCRPCLDWSERRPHVAGRLGALICAHCLTQGWLLRRAESRALDITPKGSVALRAWLGNEGWRKVAAPGAADL